MSDVAVTHTSYSDGRFTYTHDERLGVGDVTLGPGFHARTVQLDHNGEVTDPFDGGAFPHLLVGLDDAGDVLGVESLHGEVTRRDLCLVISALRFVEAAHD